MRKWLTIPLMAVLLASCEDGTLTQPDPSLARGGVAAVGPVVVMSRNLYLGADIDILLTADNLPEAIQTALEQVLVTDFRARAAFLAAEIHAVQPHLVGLQEVTNYATLDEYFEGVEVPEFGFPLNYLEVLVGELAALGDVYVPVQYTQHLILPLPFAYGDVAYIVYSDGDAILARGDVAATLTASDGGNYVAQETLNIGGFEFDNQRGYGMVDVTVNGTPLRFANTHLEIQQFRDKQEAQARELAAILAESPLPVILVGDFNSAANPDAPAGSQTRSYHILRNAGYADMWLREPHSVGGVTCCQSADLTNTTPRLNQRLDILFVRWGSAGFGGQSRMDVVGEDVSDIFMHPATDLIPFAYPQWPSDHAGIVGWLWPAPGRIAMK